MVRKGHRKLELKDRSLKRNDNLLYFMHLITAILYPINYNFYRYIRQSSQYIQFAFIKLLIETFN